MTTDTRIIKDLQVRSLAYNLLLKHPRRGRTVGQQDNIWDAVQADALKWTELLQLSTEFAEAAAEVWKEMVGNG